VPPEVEGGAWRDERVQDCQRASDGRPQQRVGHSEPTEEQGASSLLGPTMMAMECAAAEGPPPGLKLAAPEG
jgi:hypothetical protein